MKLNDIYNEDCFLTMQNMIREKFKVDLILTSPPYNTAKYDKTKSKNNFESYNTRYAEDYFDVKSNDDYMKWLWDLFSLYNMILKNAGVVLFNMSYGNMNPDVMWLAIASIIENTNFSIADCIAWKKNNALPNNTSMNKLTRLVEYIFVFCKKSRFQDFYANKQVTNDKGQKRYTCFYNFIEAPNNDGVKQSLNNATFSSDLVVKLLEYYARPDSIVYDSFMGTGTTAVGCKRFGCSFIGSELSKKQCDFARDRLEYGKYGLVLKNKGVKKLL